MGWAQRLFPNISSECLARMGGRDDPWLRRTLKYGGHRLAEFTRTLIFFGKVAFGWGRRRELRRPTILRPWMRLPPRIDVSFVLPWPNRIFPTCGRQRSAGIFARMAFRSAVMAATTRDAGEFILACCQGMVAKAHSVPKSDLARGAKEGCGPCCPRATHVAIPPMYRAGEYGWGKARGLALWMANGSWAPRRLAACKYAGDFGGLSKNWGWAAQRLNLRAPDPLARVTSPEDHPREHAIGPIMKSKPD